MTGWVVGACRHHRITKARRAPVRPRAAAMTGLMLLAVTTGAGAQTGAPPAGSLVVDPQQGATPRPLPTPAPSMPMTPTPLPTPVTTAPPIVIPPAPAVTPVAPMRGGPANPGVPAGSPLGPSRAGGLPAPSGDPLRIDPAGDPILAIARNQVSADLFNRAIADAVARNPALGEVAAQAEEADAVRREAKERALPSADLTLTSFQILSRAFSNDPRNVLERSRPRERTDGLIRVQQPIVDFGASANRIRAAEARLEAARAEVEDIGTQVALRATSAWYSVYGYRVLVRLAAAYSETQYELRRAIEDRVRQGAAAPADIAQVDSYIASADAQRADFTRLLVNAEAQYTAVIGSAPPADLARAPVPPLDGIARGTLAADTDRMPAVRAARLIAAASRRDADALKADRLPQLGASVDAGRYGVFETARDYDLRASLNLTLRLGGGAGPRVDQARARATRADARLDRTRIELQRDAEIALSDVTALEDAQEALEQNYLASRRSRDVLAERFRVARGTVFELLGAQSNYFGVAARYIQSLIELDSARYALLAKTGRLLPTLGIDPTALEAAR